MKNNNILFLLVISFLFIFTSKADANNNNFSKIVLNDNIEYFLGDFISDNNNFTEYKNWKKLDNQDLIIKKENTSNNFIWFKIHIPENIPNNFNTLFIPPTERSYHVYLEDKLIYKYQDIDNLSNTNPSSLNYSIKLLNLGENISGKNIYFRIFSKEPFIGYYHELYLSEEVSIIKRLISYDLFKLIIGMFFIIISVFSIIITFNKPRKLIFFFALFAFDTGIVTINFCLSRDLVFSSFYIPWFQLTYIVGFFLPVWFYLLFENIFNSGYKGIIKNIRNISIVYSISSIMLIHFQIFNIRFLLAPYTILSFIGVIITLIETFICAKNGDHYAKVFILTGAIASIFLGYDLLIYSNIITWRSPQAHWGTLLFMFSLGYLLQGRYLDIHKKLKVYSNELEEKNISLKQLDKLKDEFLANTSHELRTPLNGIIGIAESVIDGALGEVSTPIKNNLAMIVMSGKRLDHLVNDILDFSKLKHKDIELRLKTISANQIVDIVVTFSKLILKNKHVSIINNLNDDLPYILADEDRLQQILYNLIGNAIKFTEKGFININAAQKGNFLEISIKDTGIGISEEKIDLIFESFEQADTSISREYGGTGLGLAITKKLIELHGGTINVISKVNEGSEFIFTIPISNEKSLSELDNISKIKDYESSHQIIENTTIEGDGNFKILIVDDEPINLQVLSNHLTLKNYSVSQALNGEEVFKLIDEGLKPDLIVLDIMMPKMSGYEVCKKIREKFPTYQLPVVLLTAKNQISDLVEGFDSGANDYLTKPVSKNELLSRIKTHIELAKINNSYSKFVPREFLKFLGKDSIIEVNLGEQVQLDMTIMFSDIRSFTSLSEKMTPKENFDFINSYLSKVSPAIRKNNGFIDKYIGDGIMALFQDTPDNAIDSALEMMNILKNLNEERASKNLDSISIGIGIHTGSLMLGTIGEEERMESTVISDAVNLSSRMEGLTKPYSASIIVSEQTLNKLKNPNKYQYRFLGKVQVKGKNKYISIFEIYDLSNKEVLEMRKKTEDFFKIAIDSYYNKELSKSLSYFEKVLEIDPNDKLASFYIDKIEELEKIGINDNWNGVDKLNEK
ncbi:MAG: response regulator [Candidatus Sericytochromatia bacterium]